MNISKPALILSSAGLGLTLVYSEQGTNSAPTKAQTVLRQKIAELNRTDSSKSREERLAEAERLHKEGKISDEQYETLKKNIQEQYPAPSGSLTPEARAKAQAALEQKIAELNAGPKAAAPASSEVQTKAEQVLRQKIAEFRTPEKTNYVPSTASATLTPELEAKARELMRMKIAAAHKESPVPTQPIPEAQAKALAVLHGAETEAKAGITPDTPEQTRLLRLKIAESKGIISPEEASNASTASAAPATLAAPAAPSPGAATRVATAPTAGSPASAPRATPAIGAAPIALQSSNKTGLARLSELTDLYKADRITPYEYHHERAKIVA